MNVWIVRGLLAALLLFASEILLWTNPTGHSVMDWLIRIPGYIALGSLLLDFAARYRVRDVFGLLTLAGFYALLNGLALNPETALADVPRTWATRVLGAHTLVGFGVLLLFLALTSGRTGRLWLVAAGVGALWGIWVQGLPLFTEIAAETVSLLSMIIAGGVSLAVVAALGTLAGGRVQHAGQFMLRPLEWLLASVLVIALIMYNRVNIGALSLLVLLALAGYCWVLIWFQHREQGAALLDASLPTQSPSIGWLVAGALLFLGAAALTYSLPLSGDGSLFGLLTGLFAAFGLVWLPTVSLVLGVRSYRRLGRQQRL